MAGFSIVYWLYFVPTSGGETDDTLSPVIGVSVGAAITLLIVMICVLIRVRSSGTQHDHRHHLVVDKVTLPTLDKPSNREPPDERDPDVIPAKFGE